MSLFRNIIVPVPAEAHITRKDNRVYVVREKCYMKDRQYNIDKRDFIGKLNDTSEETMNPNTLYSVLYPDLFNRYASGKVIPLNKRIGMFTVGLASSEDNGLYKALVDSCGPDYANALMDFSLYSIQSKSNVAKDYSVVMKSQALFGDALHDDAYYSNLFTKKLTSEIIEKFRIEWVKQCIQHGISEVWLCVDGSNNNCQSENVEYAEYGEAKSHIHIPIYSYMYAVSAKDGTPVSYRIYRGGRIDSKAFIEFITFLRSYEIKVQGIILDRGFCDIGCFELIINSHYKYVIKMKETHHGFQEMVKKYGQLIKMQAEYALGNGLYGDCHKGRLFGKYNLESDMVIIYDSENGVERANYLIDSVNEEVARLQKISDNPDSKETATVGKSCKKYIQKIVIEDEVEWKRKGRLPNKMPEATREKIRLEIERLQDESRNPSNIPNLVVNPEYAPYIKKKIVRSHVIWKADKEKLQAEVDKKGFYVLACSSVKTAKEGLELYSLRDISEKQYMILKRQLGYYVSRAHSTEGTESRHLCGFVAGIIRNELWKICNEIGYDENIAIRELNFLCLERMANNSYVVIHNANQRQLKLLEKLRLIEDDLSCIAEEETNKALGKLYNQVHRITKRSLEPSDDTKNKKKASHEKKEKEQTDQNVEKPKSNRGRKKGSKNKKPAVNAKQKRAEARAKKQVENA